MSLNLCSTAGGNTGGIACSQAPGVAKKILLGTGSFAKADYASQALFEAALTAAIMLPEGSSGKLYPFPEIKEIENKTEANKEGTLGLGYKETLSEGLPAYNYKVKVGQDQYQKMRKFNGVTIPVYTLDGNGNIWGMVNANGTFSGISASIFVSGNGFGDGNGIVTAVISVSYQSASDFNDSGKYFPMTLGYNEVQGLLDVDLTEISHASNVYKIAATIDTAQLGTTLNMYDDYADALAVAGLWKAYTGANYATPLTITSVAKDPTVKGWTVTFDSTAFSALSTGAKIKLEFTTPALLDAADISGTSGYSAGYESVALIITKP